MVISNLRNIARRRGGHWPLIIWEIDSRREIPGLSPNAKISDELDIAFQ